METKVPGGKVPAFSAAAVPTLGGFEPTQRDSDWEGKENRMPRPGPTGLFHILKLGNSYQEQECDHREGNAKLSKNAQSVTTSKRSIYVDKFKVLTQLFQTGY